MVDPFKAPKFEVPEEMRDFANKSVEQAKRAFDSFMGATQEAAANLKGSAETMQRNAADATHQVVGYAEQNVKAAFEHAQALVKAKGFDEVMAPWARSSRTPPSRNDHRSVGKGRPAKRPGVISRQPFPCRPFL